MVKEAQEHESEDKAKLEQVTRRNKLDNLCYTIEKTLTDNKDKIPEADAKSLKEIIVESRSAIEKQDDAAITACLEKLEKEAHKIAGAMYGQGGPGAPGGPGDGAARRIRVRRGVGVGR